LLLAGADFRPSLATAFETAGAWNIGTGTALGARFGFSAAGSTDFVTGASPATAFFLRVRTFFSTGESAGSLAIFYKPQILVKIFFRAAT
jgi:hypothetical protein